MDADKKPKRLDLHQIVHENLQAIHLRRITLIVLSRKYKYM